MPAVGRGLHCSSPLCLPWASVRLRDLFGFRTLGSSDAILGFHQGSFALLYSPPAYPTLTSSKEKFDACMATCCTSWRRREALGLRVQGLKGFRSRGSLEMNLRPETPERGNPEMKAWSAYGKGRRTLVQHGRTLHVPQMNPP